MLSIDLATHGMNPAVAFGILKRHLYAFYRHLTVRKLLNFCRTEYSRLTKKTSVGSFPYILKLETTNMCNLSCAYCYDGRRPPLEGERPYGRMSLEGFKGLIDELAPYLFKINLYGFGEPFLDPQCIDMIAYATRHNVGVGVSSNMNFVDDTLARRIVESGLEVLIFSCHGVTQESYRKFMVKGNMGLAFKNISEVIAQRELAGSNTPFIDWQFCVTGFNQGEIEAARARAIELGIDQVRFIKPFFPEDAAQEWFSDLFPRHSSTILVNQGDARRQTGCSWPYRSAYINYDGGVLPCCKDTRLIANDFGNVFRGSFASIWNNERYVSSRALIARGQAGCQTMCARCSITRDKRRGSSAPNGTSGR
ncbi:MAG: SPASM domain-containing protein [Nitrospirae bacterium]|nr:SPASM domain-containing protein [Nitrospirota bacterium]MBF0593246.1 SPASM domain-containing protein [Nitrospirota bacterium]